MDYIAVTYLKMRKIWGKGLFVMSSVKTLLLSARLGTFTCQKESLYSNAFKYFPRLEINVMGRKILKKNTSVDGLRLKTKLDFFL